jgi:hypothetical protein
MAPVNTSAQRNKTAKSWALCPFVRLRSDVESRPTQKPPASATAAAAKTANCGQSRRAGQPANTLLAMAAAASKPSAANKSQVPGLMGLRPFVASAERCAIHATHVNQMPHPVNAKKLVSKLAVGRLGSENNAGTAMAAKSAATLTRVHGRRSEAGVIGAFAFALEKDGRTAEYAGVDAGKTAPKGR